MSDYQRDFFLREWRAKVKHAGQGCMAFFSGRAFLGLIIICLIRLVFEFDAMIASFLLVAIEFFYFLIIWTVSEIFT